MRYVTLVLVLFLFGCSAPLEQQPTPTPTASPTPTDTVTPVPPWEPDDDGDGPPAWQVSPDPAIIASMECEPISEDTQQQIGALWGDIYVDGVQVEVGEGNTPGELWWVVIFAYSDDSEGFMSWLTNQPGLPGERGTWINAGVRVEVEGEWLTMIGADWDHERMVRAQSATIAAWDCLGGDPDLPDD